jgi:hypothetical protein
VSYGESVRGGVAKAAVIGDEAGAVGDEEWGQAMGERVREGAGEEGTGVVDGGGKRVA